MDWLRSLFPARRRGVVVRKEGYIRPNVLTGGGYYRIRVRSDDGEWDLLVADYERYQRVPEGVALEFAIRRRGGDVWLTGFRPV